MVVLPEGWYCGLLGSVALPADIAFVWRVALIPLSSVGK